MSDGSLVAEAVYKAIEETKGEGWNWSCASMKPGELSETEPGLPSHNLTLCHLTVRESSDQYPSFLFKMDLKNPDPAQRGAFLDLRCEIGERVGSATEHSPDHTLSPEDAKTALSLVEAQVRDHLARSQEIQQSGSGMPGC